MAIDATHQLPDLASRLRRREVKRTVPDDRLVSRLRAGDERAFDAIFERYHLPLLAFCRHMLGTREEAEDALQHVFVSAHKHLVEADAVVDLRPWLYAIARNRCLSVLRARREALPLDDVPEPSGAGLAVAAEVEQRQDLREMLGDLARLPDDQRAALVLSELGSLSHDEIAATLDVRRDKVKALVFQAREQLAGLRNARSADCREIREQLANLRGGALRRGPLRKHLEVCDGCREFRGEVRRQREALALLLPVIPSIALKAKIIGAVAVTGSAGIPVAGAGLAGAGLAAGAPAVGGSAAFAGGFAAKALVVATIAGVAGGGYAVVREQSAVSTGPVVGPIHRTGPVEGLPATRATPPAQGRLPSASAPSRKPAKQGHDGRPADPGAAGHAKAGKSQGAAHRPTGVPSHGAKANGKAKAGVPANSNGRAHAAKPAKPAKPAHLKPAHPAHPAKPIKSKAPPAAPGSTGTSKTVPETSGRPETPPGQAKKDANATTDRTAPAIE